MKIIYYFSNQTTNRRYCAHNTYNCIDFTSLGNTLAVTTEISPCFSLPNEAKMCARGPEQDYKSRIKTNLWKQKINAEACTPFATVLCVKGKHPMALNI